jgi:predicted nuclease of predicted toxin-antitoxin system
MKFLLDQDVYACTMLFLREQGHDVVTLAQTGQSRADDEVVLEMAREQGRLLITRDRDFGNLVFVKKLGAGVLYLRMIPSMQNAVHDELEKVIKSYQEDELKTAFIVIEPSGHRIRKVLDK